MNLTKNEKRTLKLLIENSRISDTEVATRLNITKQAVGKIKRKLEQTGIIKGYSVNLDYGQLGIHTFALIHAKLTQEGWEKFGELGVEQLLVDTPQIINAYRLPEGNTTHVLLFGFKDLFELDTHFCSKNHRTGFQRYFETKAIHIFSHHSLIKSNSPQLINDILDNGDKRFKRFDQIEVFKNKQQPTSSEQF